MSNSLKSIINLGKVDIYMNNTIVLIGILLLSSILLFGCIGGNKVIIMSDNILDVNGLDLNGTTGAIPFLTDSNTLTFYLDFNYDSNTGTLYIPFIIGDGGGLTGLGLENYVPYTGATADVNLGIKDLLVYEIKDIEDVRSIIVNARMLYDKDKNRSINWDLRILNDEDEINSIQWDNRFLINENEDIAASWREGFKLHLDMLGNGRSITGAQDVNVTQFMKADCYYFLDGTKLCNLADLNTDLNYLQSGDNISELINDSGYITSYTDTNIWSEGVLNDNNVWQGDFNVLGNTYFDGNVFYTMPHMFGIADTAQSINVINEWQAIDFNFLLGDSYGFGLQDSNGLVVTQSGHYFISLEVQFIDASSSPTSNTGIRITKNGVELSGSYSEVDVIKQNASEEITTFAFAEVMNGDVLMMEFISDDIDVSVYSDNTWATQNLVAKGMIQWISPIHD